MSPQCFRRGRAFASERGGVSFRTWINPKPPRAWVSSLYKWSQWYQPERMGGKKVIETRCAAEHLGTWSVSSAWWLLFVTLH